MYKIFILKVYKETIQPIAVYEAPWLPIERILIHISLIEQSLGKTKLQYWLRVGVMKEDEDEEGNDDTLHVLNYLSSDAGKYINENSFDWVDLASVNFNDYMIILYMNNY